MRKYGRAFIVWLAFNITGIISTHLYDTSASSIQMLYLLKTLTSIGLIYLIHDVFFSDLEKKEPGKSNSGGTE